LGGALLLCPEGCGSSAGLLLGPPEGRWPPCCVFRLGSHLVRLAGSEPQTPVWMGLEQEREFGCLGRSIANSRGRGVRAGTEQGCGQWASPGGQRGPCVLGFRENSVVLKPFCAMPATHFRGPQGHCFSRREGPLALLRGPWRRMPPPPNPPQGGGCPTLLVGDLTEWSRSLRVLGSWGHRPLPTTQALAAHGARDPCGGRTSICCGMFAL